MPVTKKQSAISDVRDQLSLDYASGTYLNNISNNLGFTRPKFGFDDDTWRAITRVLAVQEKQVKDKFADLMTVLFGPYITQSFTLAKSAHVGDKILSLNSTEGLPLIGSLIIDEGLSSEETVKYILVDKYNNLVYLDAPIGFDHSAVKRDFSAFLVIPSSTSDSTLYVNDVSTYPTTFIPGPLVLSPGLENEETVQVTGVDTSDNSISLTSPPIYDHDAPTSTSPVVSVATNYLNNSNILLLTDSSQFDYSGYINVFVTADTATGGTTFSVIGSGAYLPMVPASQVGTYIVFAGNVTSALKGVKAYVDDNNTVAFLFSKNLPAAPVAGDTFYVYANKEYTQNDYENNFLVLKNSFGFTVGPTTSSTVTPCKINTTVNLSQIKVAQGCWDVQQVSPRVVDLLLCEELNENFDLRSASYLHDVVKTTVTTTSSADCFVGDSFINVTSNVAFPMFCEVDIGSTVFSVSKRSLTATANASTSTNTVINLTSTILGSNALAGSLVRFEGLDFYATVASNTTTSITLTLPIPDYVLSSLSINNTIIYIDPKKLYFGYKTPVSIISSGTTIQLHQFALTGNVINGDMWANPTKALFSGPYVYDILEQAPNGNTVYSALGTSYGRLSKALPGVVPLLVDATINGTAIEVKDAKYFEDVDFPYNAVLGDGTSQREQVEILALSYRSLTGTTTSGGISPGATTITVTSLTGGANGNFPIASGYRIILDEGNPSQEIFYVSSVNPTTKTFTVVDPATSSHSSGATVRLVADVFTIDTLVNNHTGIIPLPQAGQNFPSFPSTRYGLAEGLSMLVDHISLVSTAGFPTSGKVILNKGSGLTTVSTKLTSDDSNSGTLHVASAAKFYSLWSAATGKFKVTVSKGSPNEEVLFINTVTTGPDTLIYDLNERKSHYTGDLVVMEGPIEEVLEYSSISGNTLRFSSPIMLKSTHERFETVIPSVQISMPRATGYDFPLRLPPNIEFRLRFIIDLIRAAGVQVNIVILPEQELLALRR